MPFNIISIVARVNRNFSRFPLSYIRYSLDLLILSRVTNRLSDERCDASVNIISDANYYVIFAVHIRYTYLATAIFDLHTTITTNSESRNRTTSCSLMDAQPVYNVRSNSRTFFIGIKMSLVKIHIFYWTSTDVMWIFRNGIKNWNVY